MLVISSITSCLQALSQGRIRPEYVPPEDRLPLQQADYDTYFEFDRPVASGINPNTEDLLVEEALGVRRSWPQAQAGEAGHLRAAPCHRTHSAPRRPRSRLTTTPQRCRSRCWFSQSTWQSRSISPSLSNVSLDLLRLSSWGSARERAV